MQITISRLEKIRFLLTEKQLQKGSNSDGELLELFREVFNDLAILNFEDAKYIRTYLFAISDEHHDFFLSFLYTLLHQQFQVIIGKPLLKVEDDLGEVKNLEAVADFLFDTLELVVPTPENYRLSSQILSPDLIPEDMRMTLLWLIIGLVQSDPQTNRWARDEIVGTIPFLSLGRQVSLIIYRLDLFYALLGTVIEKLNSSQMFQIAKDFGEESLITSFIDNRREWGYMTLFRAFNGQYNVSMALIYANACVASIKVLPAIPDLLLKTLLLITHRFYRNIGAAGEAESLYNFMLNFMELDEVDVFGIKNTQFHIQTAQGDSTVVTEVHKYIVEKREFILLCGKQIALPLLQTTHNVRQVFNSKADVAILDEDIRMLESIAGDEAAQRIRAITYGDSSDLKRIYIEMLLALQNTRSADDFISEVHNALIVSERLVIFALENNDATAFLLAMILRADYSWVFNENTALPSSGLVKIEFKEPTEDELDLYEHYDERLVKLLNLDEGCECLWLTAAEGEVLCLSLTGQQFSQISPANAWQLDKMNEWLSQGFSDLRFDETQKEYGQVRQYLEEDQLQDYERVKSLLAFAKIEIGSPRELIIVKDMLLSAMPHNLILDGGGEFISRSIPLTCLPSAEWFISREQTNATLRPDFSTALWIPTEAGDMALNYLWSKLSDSIEGSDIGVTNAPWPDAPLSSDINILSAHGDTDIKTFHAFFTGEEAPIVDLDSVVGRGSIAVLFVCHSGSMAKGVFRQRIMSLIRKFIEMGYEAVIAPFWSLHISVPPVWLPEFLRSMRNKLSVSEAVFRANSKVYGTNKSPGAWACLHLYGNPFFKME